MAKWITRQQNDVSAFHGLKFSPIILQLLSFRGLDTKEKIKSFLKPDYEKDVYDPFLFLDMEKVVSRIKKAKETGELVAIFGDYDADGITSSAILKHTLDELKIESFVYIPDKKSEGYGLNTAAIEQFNERGVKLIITVDCGITNIKEIEKANEFGIDTIVTDHHHVPEKLPDAFAIINPNMKNCGYPFDKLAGVGVAFKVVQAIYNKLLAEKKEYTKWLLDLVAIGTVADCVPLVGENRVFVKYGLIVLSKTKRKGLKELFEVGRMVIDENNVPDVRKISFHIAPRINAAGRINHANLAYNLIMEENQAHCRNFALELESNNGQRQKITDQLVTEVKMLAENMFKNKKFIFAAGPHFPIGVVGLVAGKIAQEFNKPTAIFQKGETESKGSFRSIAQINIIETIEKCGEFLTRFGGHSQAAGVTVENKNLDAFFGKMNELIESELEEKDISPQLLIDVEIVPADVDFPLVDAIEKMKPFGEGNPEPVFFMKNLLIEEKKLVGNGNKHIKIFLRAGDNTPKIFEAIGFNLANDCEKLQKSDSVDIVFNLQKDEWNGNNKIQFSLIDIRKTKE